MIRSFDSPSVAALSITQDYSRMMKTLNSVLLLMLAVLLECGIGITREADLTIPKGGIDGHRPEVLQLNVPAGKGATNDAAVFGLVLGIWNEGSGPFPASTLLTVQCSVSLSVCGVQTLTSDESRLRGIREYSGAGAVLPGDVDNGLSALQPGSVITVKVVTVDGAGKATNLVSVPITISP